jgi:hypothetical protein
MNRENYKNEDNLCRPRYYIVRVVVLIVNKERNFVLMNVSMINRVKRIYVYDIFLIEYKIRKKGKRQDSRM